MYRSHFGSSALSKPSSVPCLNLPLCLAMALREEGINQRKKILKKRIKRPSSLLLKMTRGWWNNVSEISKHLRNPMISEVDVQQLRECILDMKSHLENNEMCFYRMDKERLVSCLNTTLDICYMRNLIRHLVSVRRWCHSVRVVLTASDLVMDSQSKIK